RWSKRKWVAGEKKERPRQCTENQELVPECGGILVLEGIIEASVPRIEQKCNADLCQFNKEDGAKETASGPPILRTEIGQRKLGNLCEGSAATAHSITPTCPPRRPDGALGSLWDPSDGSDLR